MRNSTKDMDIASYSRPHSRSMVPSNWVESQLSNNVPLYPRKRSSLSTGGNVRFVPKADIRSYSITSSVSARGGTCFGANEAQMTDDFVATAMVCRMVDAIDHRHVGKIKRAHAL